MGWNFYDDVMMVVHRQIVREARALNKTFGKVAGKCLVSNRSMIATEMCRWPATLSDEVS